VEFLIKIRRKIESPLSHQDAKLHKEEIIPDVPGGIRASIKEED